MADEYLLKTLEDIKAQISAKVGDATRLLVTANTLEEMVGAQKTSLFDYVGDGADQSSAPAATALRNGGSLGNTTRGTSSRAIKPDTFLGQQPLDAAKRYLAMVGHAV